MKSGIISAAVITCGLAFAAPASAQGVKIGILNDQSGVYADYGGKYSLEAARMMPLTMSARLMAMFIASRTRTSDTIGREVL